MDLLTRLATRRARAMVLAAVAAALLAAVLGAPVAGRLTGGNPDFVTPGSGSVLADHRIQQATGVHADGGVIALVDTGTPVTDPRAHAEAGKLARLMASDPHHAFARVSGFDQGKDPALVSKDGRLGLVVGEFRAGAGDHYQDAVKRLLHLTAGDRYVRLGGSEVVGEQVVGTVQHDLERAELAAFPVLFVLSLWIFRSLVASALPLVIGGLNVVLTLLGMRIVDHFTPLSIFSLNLVTALGLGLAIDYSLLIVSRFRSELALDPDVSRAIAVTLHTAGRTILFSSLTVSAAMAALFVFRQRFLYSMAVGGLLVAVSALLVALLVLPALLRLLGRHLDFLAPRRLHRALEKPESTDGGWFRLARGVMRRAPLVAVGASAFLILLGLPFARAQFTTVGPGSLPGSASSRAVDDTLRARFPADPLEAVQVVVSAGPAAAPRVEALRDRIARLPGAAAVSAPVRLDGGTWLIQAAPRAPGLSAQSRQLVKDIRDLPAPGPTAPTASGPTTSGPTAPAPIAPGHIAVGGQSATFVDLEASLLARLPVAAAIVFLTSMLVLLLMTGSAVLPLKAVVMNLLTLAATFGVLTAVFQHGHGAGLFGTSGQGALDATQPVLLFAMVFGLSTDYGVFLLARIKEARDSGVGEREAVALGLGRTGRVVTAAALLFCVALGALATSRIVFIKELGLGTALGVLLDATVVRALLVPSLMALLGRWNWWAPAPLRWVYERYGLREGASRTPQEAGALRVAADEP
ncbi:MMPL family transporter [Actinacidiphila epipremni]|uniref:MMPL family transporter n=1 Tax=Actinacidiphila epipremni TaxID=2053013 RepID=A0ABX0ZLQ5_9ACTN|nr:MMPL family transporter [Actinacidiphila epipremni]NJP43452.1 MMPL family transporter [Actinacidiphila epipremni]